MCIVKTTVELSTKDIYARFSTRKKIYHNFWRKRVTDNSRIIFLKFVKLHAHAIAAFLDRVMENCSVQLKGAKVWVEEKVEVRISYPTLIITLRNSLNHKLVCLLKLLAGKVICTSFYNSNLLQDTTKVVSQKPNREWLNAFTSHLGFIQTCVSNLSPL